MVGIFQTISSGASAAYKDIQKVTGPLLGPSEQKAVLASIFGQKATMTVNINGKPVQMNVNANTIQPGGPEGDIVAIAGTDLATIVASNAADNAASNAAEALIPIATDTASITSRIGSTLSGAFNFIKPGLSAASKIGIPALIVGAGAYYGATAIGAGAQNLGAGIDNLIGKTPPTPAQQVSFTGQPYGSSGGPSTTTSITTPGPTGGSSLLGALSGFDILVLLGIGVFVVYEVAKR